jgi:hypothetical protein
VAEKVPDTYVVAVLRPFVRATTPMLTALRESDPLGLVRRVLPAVRTNVLSARHRRSGAGVPRDTHEQEGIEPAEAGLPGTMAVADREDVRALDGVARGFREKLLDGLESVKVPGTAAWARMSVHDRTDWWVNRVGRFTVLLAAVPGLGGALADRLPLQDTLAVASQGLLLSAIAAEHGVTSQADRVRLIAAVLFERNVDPAVAAGAGSKVSTDEEDRATEELTGELTEATRKYGKITVRAAARTLWRFGTTLRALGDELDKRPQGRFYHQALGMVPVAGILGNYLGERSALKCAAKSAQRWLAANHPSS